jgi:hypothetical protein
MILWIRATTISRPASPICWTGARDDHPRGWRRRRDHRRGPAEGDAALLELTARFDRWQPADATALRVTEAEIDAAVAACEPALMAALDHAATRIEAFHRAQMPADIELDDPAGLTLGMRWNAHGRRGPLRARRQGGLPLLRADERHAGPRGRRGARRHVRADAGRRAEPAGAGRGPPGRRHRDLAHRRRPGHRRAGLGHGEHRAGGPRRRPRQRLCGRGQAAGLRPRRHRLHRRPFRGRGPRRLDATTPPMSRWTCWPRPSTTKRAIHPHHRHAGVSPAR